MTEIAPEPESPAVQEIDPPATVTALPWEQFAAMFFEEHEPGEHCSIVGPTGSGKSVLGVFLARILGLRKTTDEKGGYRRPARVTVFATKPRDRTISALGWPVIRSSRDWPPGHGKEHVIVWPRTPDPGQAKIRARATIEPILRAIYQEGRQTIYVDEVATFTGRPPEGMGLRGLMAEFWQTGRSLELTVIAGTQRPVEVPRSMWSEPAWLFVFRLHDFDDLRRVGEIAGDRDELRAAVEHLGGHEFICVHRPRSGERRMFASRVE